MPTRASGLALGFFADGGGETFHSCGDVFGGEGAGLHGVVQSKLRMPMSRRRCEPGKSMRSGGGVGFGDGFLAGAATGHHGEHAAAVGFPIAIDVLAGAGVVNPEVARISEAGDEIAGA